MEDFTDLLQGVEVGDAGSIRGGVDGDFGDVDGPGVCGIGFATVVLVVPEDVTGGLIAGFGLECSMLGNVLESCAAEVSWSVVVVEVAIRDQGGAE